MSNDANPPIPVVGGDDDDSVFGWVREALTESENALKAERGYDKIQEGIDAIMGSGDGVPGARLSNVRSNRIAKITSDLAALLTDTKAFWEYKTSNPLYDKQEDNLGKLSQNWYYNRQIDMRLSDGIRYWAVGGTSYISQHFNSSIQDIDARAEDPRDVLPVRPSGYETLQSAMGVITRREEPVNYVRGLYPEKAALITADRDGSLAQTGGGPTAQLYRSLGMDGSALIASSMFFAVSATSSPAATATCTLRPAM